MIPKPSPPKLSPEALAFNRRLLVRETEIRARAMKFWPHPTAKEIVAACDAGIADILRTHPEVAL